jgi:hypothetical protein
MDGSCICPSNGIYKVDFETIVTKSKFTHQVREMSLGKSEFLMHNKEQHQQAEYYAELGKFIGEYNEVVISGPQTQKQNW